jgi:riboflavin synthase alpha subunit
MFTGIVEATGTLVAIAPTPGGSRVIVDCEFAGDVAPGASLAVNGVCLTVVNRSGRHLHFDVGPETARVTTFGSQRPGQMVNLERPMRMNGRLDGHFVLGHVDAVGFVNAIGPDRDAHSLTVGFPAELAPLFIPKGSVAVDGISLTVARLRDREFDIQVIPYTWAHTTLQARQPGDPVNLECDVIGKYVLRSLEVRNA